MTLKSRSVEYSDDSYGSTDDSYTESTISALLTRPDENSKLVQMGVIKNGDMVAHVKSTVTINEGDRIVISGTDWEVVSTAEPQYQGEVVYKQIGLSKRLIDA